MLCVCLCLLCACISGKYTHLLRSPNAHHNPQQQRNGEQQQRTKASSRDRATCAPSTIRTKRA